MNSLLSAYADETNAAELAYKARNFDLAYASLKSAQRLDLKIEAMRKNRGNWLFYHEGLANAKLDDKELKRQGKISKAKLHAKALKGCYELLQYCEGMEEWLVEPLVSAIDLLMLLKKGEEESLFRKGKLMLDRMNIPDADKEDQESKLLNSLGLTLRRVNPGRATRIFRRAVNLAKYRTVNHGNPLQGESDCWKNLLVEAKEESKVELFYSKASECLNTALEVYPASETGHLDATRKRMEDLETAKKKRLAELEKMKKLRDSEGAADDRK